MPYFPPSVTDLPATRFILFSDANNKTRIIDESEVLRQGIFSFVGKWETPTLNREDPTKIYTLRKLMVLYEASEDTSISLYPTGDGGRSYGRPVVLEKIESSGSETKRAVGGFNTSGFDLRVRIDFDTDEVVTIYGYKATIVERSDIILS
jgi:hypothetical protein